MGTEVAVRMMLEASTSDPDAITGMRYSTSQVFAGGAEFCLAVQRLNYALR